MIPMCNGKQFWLTGVLVLALTWLAQAAPDQVTLSDGRVIAGEITFWGEHEIEITITLPFGKAAQPFKRSDVERVTLGWTEEEQALFNTTNYQDLAKLEALWDRKKIFLGVPETRVGEIGHRIVALHLGRGTKVGGKAALKWIEQLSGDWNPQRRATLDSLRISALVAAGELEKAEKAAEKLTALSGADELKVAAARIDKEFAQAQVLWGRRRQLEQEFPRWDLLPQKEEERRQLIHGALDRLLYPVVFHAELPGLCARGLVNAARIHLEIGQPEQAQRLAREVIEHFPEPDWVPQAKEIEAAAAKTLKTQNSKDRRS